MPKATSVVRPDGATRRGVRRSARHGADHWRSEPLLPLAPRSRRPGRGESLAPAWMTRCGRRWLARRPHRSLARVQRPRRDSAHGQDVEPGCRGAAGRGGDGVVRWATPGDPVPRRWPVTIAVSASCKPFSQSRTTRPRTVPRPRGDPGGRTTRALRSSDGDVTRIGKLRLVAVHQAPAIGAEHEDPTG